MAGKSGKIIRYYRSIVYWCEGLERISACWRAREQGIEYTEEESKKMHEAGNHLESAKKLVNEVYSKRIGEAVTFDIRTGDFKIK